MKNDRLRPVGANFLDEEEDDAGSLPVFDFSLNFFVEGFDVSLSLLFPGLESTSSEAVLSVC